MKNSLLMTTAAVTFVIAASTGAAAQDGSQSSSVDETAASKDEIIVTVRRREEKLTEVPTAASVIDADSLADRGGARTSLELLADQPSVRFNNLNTPVTSEISIRASSTARATTGDPSVGLFRNGSYIGGGAIGGRNFSRLDFLDIGRVEVLRGTQGALYGRNAVGGAINIISARPEFDYGGFVNARYTFENDGFQTQGAINVPAGENLAFRLSGDVVEQDKGFFFNPDNGVYFDREEGFGLRGQARYRNDAVDVTLLLETQELTPPSIHYQIAIAAGAPGFPGGYIQPQFSYPWSTPPRTEQNIDGYQAIATFDLGGAELSSTTLFRTRNSEYDLDNDALSAQELARAVAAGQVSPFVASFTDPNSATLVVDETDSFSQDLHLAGDAADGALTWLIGGEALILDSDFSIATLRTPTAFNPSAGDIVRSLLESESFAAYGSLGYDLTGRLNLTGELRYTADDRAITSRQVAIDTGVPTGGPSRIIDGSISSDNLSYNVTASYDLGSDILAYAKVGSSYRAGGFNIRLSDPRAPEPAQVLFGDENSRSYEAGVKGSPVPQTYFAIAGYFTELKDLIAQVDDGCFVGSPVCPVVAVAYLTNAGDAESWGVEGEFNAEFDLGRTRGNLALAASHQGGEVKSGPFAGLELAQVPDVLASAVLDLTYPLGEDVSLNGNVLVSTQWGGKQELRATSADLDDYQLLNLRVGLKFEGFEVTAFANNLLDQVYIVAQAPTINRYSQPRVFGVEVGYRW
jgi:iron complex outermembrane receptor protein